MRSRSPRRADPELVQLLRGMGSVARALDHRPALAANVLRRHVDKVRTHARRAEAAGDEGRAGPLFVAVMVAEHGWRRLVEGNHEGARRAVLAARALLGDAVVASAADADDARSAPARAMPGGPGGAVKVA